MGTDYCRRIPGSSGLGIANSILPPPPCRRADDYRKSATRIYPTGPKNGRYCCPATGVRRESRVPPNGKNVFSNKNDTIVGRLPSGGRTKAGGQGEVAYVQSGPVADGRGKRSEIIINDTILIDT